MGIHEDRAKLENPNAAHSLYSASGSAGWMNCAGYLHANYGLPDTAGEDAAYGTVCHFLVEQTLKGEDLHSYIGQTLTAEAGGSKFYIPVDHAMIGYVEDALARVADVDGDRFFETRVNYDDLTPLRFQGGTCDFAACKPGLLRIKDWKFGKGVKVYAKDNPQPFLYAYGFFREWDFIYGFEEIEIEIVQPRLDHYDTTRVSRRDLVDFAAYARERAAMAWPVDAPRTPGPKQCQWCKAQATCGAFLLLAESLADGLLDDLSEGAVQVTTTEVASAKERLRSGRSFDLPNPLDMETADLVRLLPWRRVFDRFWNQAGEVLLNRHDGGETIEGMKVVEGRTHRKFIDDEQEVVDKLVTLGLERKKVYKSVLISPSQTVEQLRLVRQTAKGKPLPRKDAETLIESLVIQPPGERTLVPVSDSRQALPEAESYLDDVSGDDL